MGDMTLKVRGSRIKMAAIFLGSLLFAAGGLLMISDGSAFGWFITVFSGLTVLTGIFFLIKGPPELLLTERGFQMSTMFKPAVFVWSDVTGFYVCQVSGVKMIGMSFSPTYKRHKAMRNFTERFTGHASVIPNNYAISTEEICLILNEWLERYGTQQNIRK